MDLLLEQRTARLTLKAATARSARADVADRAAFAMMLDAEIPTSWPIDVMRDVQGYFARQLETGAVTPGWAMWYIVFDDNRSARKLIGVVGFYGPPDFDGIATLGYGVIPGVEGQGFASEALAGLLAWGTAHATVHGFRATTFERHFASIRVLERNAFRCIGPSPDDGDVPDHDRQGRGRLMIWQRDR